MVCIMKTWDSACWTTAGKRAWPLTRYAFPLFSHGTTSISPTHNELFDPVQERSRDGCVEAYTPQLWQLAWQLPLRQGVCKGLFTLFGVTWYPFLTNPTSK